MRLNVLEWLDTLEQEGRALDQEMEAAPWPRSRHETPLTPRPPPPAPSPSPAPMPSPAPQQEVYRPPSTPRPPPPPPPRGPAPVSSPASVLPSAPVPPAQQQQGYRPYWPPRLICPLCRRDKDEGWPHRAVITDCCSNSPSPALLSPLQKRFRINGAGGVVGRPFVLQKLFHRIPPTGSAPAATLPLVQRRHPSGRRDGGDLLRIVGPFACLPACLSFFFSSFFYSALLAIYPFII